MQLTGQLSYLLYAASIVAGVPVVKRAGTTYNGGKSSPLPMLYQPNADHIDRPNGNRR